MLIVSLPVLDLQYPPSSPAVIKSCLKAAGFQARTYDLNILLQEICGNRDRFLQVQYNFENVGPKDIGSTQDPVLAFFDQDHETIRQWVDTSIDIIEKNDPRWLGVSVFSYKSHKSCLLLLSEIKKRSLPVKIVLGGRGASSYALGPDHSQFRRRIERFLGPYPKPSRNFAETMLYYGLTNKVIQGDGEQAVIDLLTQDIADNFVSDVTDLNLELIPFVDFDDYDLSAYEYINEPILPITGSKGCVRKCTFCDIPVLWPKFRFRSGDHIAREMIHLYERHGVRKFYMTDSLVNGSLKAFNDLTSTLARYNQLNLDAEIRWVGQYITRPKSAALDNDYYDRLKASGAEGLTIGVESGSDAVRAHMKKQFTTADVDHELEQFDRRSIVCVLLFFSCYPTETWQDFLDTVKMFVRYQKYCASGTIYKITLGTPYTHHPQTPLWNMQDEIGLRSQPGSDILWLLTDNPMLTYRERIRRRLILQEVAIALKLPMSRNTAEINQLKDSLTNHFKDIHDYFGPEKITLHPDFDGLTGHAEILMPPEIQDLLSKHICSNPGLASQIIQRHANIRDDIKFDNDAYLSLRSILIKGLPNENTSQ
jgi:radical SAM superfamily enzyme YgiQ (UPF0313 family)